MTPSKKHYFSVTGIVLTCAAVAVPLLVWAASTFVTIDSIGNVGLYTSTAISADTYPVISYQDASNGDLKVAKCNDNNCSSPTITTLDSTGNVGLYTSIAVPADTYPVISYYDATNSDLKVAKCSDAACTAATVTTIDTTGAVGLFTSIAIGSDGLPIISYFDTSNADLKVAKCRNALCSSTTITTVDSLNNTGQYSDIAVDSNGIPVISYSYVLGNDLRVAKCANSGCTAIQSITTLDSTGSVGQYTSIAIPGDSYPVISYYDGSNADLKVAKCSNSGCTTSTTLTTIDSTGNVGQYTSIALANDGLPMISYYDVTNGDLKMAKCTNASCSTFTIKTVDSSGTAGPHTSIALASDTYPVISYYYVTSNDFKFVHCDRASCLQLTPPGSVTGLSASAAGNTATLNWTNPTSTLALTHIIRRSSTTYPLSTTDGTAVASTSGTSYTDTGLSNGIYYYSIFTQDEDGNLSTSSAITAVTIGPSDLCSLKAYWTCDNSVSAPSDATGNGYNATSVTGTLSLSTDVPTTGFSNPYSYSFSGANITLPRPIADDFTICSWIKTTGTGAGTGTQHYWSMAIVHAEIPFAANDFGYGIDGNGKLSFGNGNGSTEANIHGSTKVNTGNWIHACVTRVKSSGSIHLYINGVDDGSGSGSTTSLTSSATINIGYGTDGATYWKGNLDDIRMYEYVLSPAEIARLAGGSVNMCTFGGSSSSESVSNMSPVNSPHAGGSRGNSTALIVQAMKQKITTMMSHQAAPGTPKETMDAGLQKRTCERVAKWFGNSQILKDRVNARLEKRFGFTCTE